MVPRGNIFFSELEIHQADVLIILTLTANPNTPYKKNVDIPLLRYSRSQIRIPQPHNNSRYIANTLILLWCVCVVSIAIMLLAEG